MKKHTTFRIGGPADYLIFPNSMEDVAFVFRCLRKFDVPFVILGNGSNVLVLDKGIRGAVVKFNSPIPLFERTAAFLRWGRERFYVMYRDSQPKEALRAWSLLAAYQAASAELYS